MWCWQRTTSANLCCRSKMQWWIVPACFQQINIFHQLAWHSRNKAVHPRDTLQCEKLQLKHSLQQTDEHHHRLSLDCWQQAFHINSSNKFVWRAVRAKMSNLRKPEPNWASQQTLPWRARHLRQLRSCKVVLAWNWQFTPFIIQGRNMKGDNNRGHWAIAGCHTLWQKRGQGQQQGHPPRLVTLGLPTVLQKFANRGLAGDWTADQESVMHAAQKWTFCLLWPFVKSMLVLNPVLKVSLVEVCFSGACAPLWAHQAAGAASSSTHPCRLLGESCVLWSS